MNTIAFNVLQGVFCLLYFSLFFFWYNIRKYEPFRRISKSISYAFSAPVIAALTLISVSILFIVESCVLAVEHHAVHIADFRIVNGSDELVVLHPVLDGVLRRTQKVLTV
jgi:hypothetical protein